MLRVLIAEDSITCRDLLIALVESDPELSVAGTASNGQQAIDQVKQLHPDVVIMDIHMPVLDGFEATRRIMVERPTPIVIVSASLNVQEATVSMHALRVGALTVLQKPALDASADFAEVAQQFTATVRAMAGVRVVRRWSDRPAQAKEAHGGAGPARIVAIAASTGGPAALYRVLSELPKDFAVPILVVQHIAPGFVPALASWLAGASPLAVKVAEHGDVLAPGTVYFAPDDRHLVLADRGTLEISAKPAVGGFRPSGTVLFESVAQVYGGAGIGVILTGMGEDGLRGLQALRAVGGQIVAQDEASSVVFGMPGAAVDAGIADAIVPLHMVAAQLRRMIGGASGVARSDMKRRT
jgi:two-component system, chemotaxis family, protein-glutamate methylesterase/glutaminase